MDGETPVTSTNTQCLYIDFKLHSIVSAERPIFVLDQREYLLTHNWKNNARNLELGISLIGTFCE